MKTVSSTLALAGLVASVAGHGFVTDPPSRKAGDALKAACGEQVYYNQVSDNYGNIQGELQIASNQNDYNAEACDIWLCKGYKFADNSANVQSYTAGQTIDFTVDIRAPHEGVANVSIVDTASNSIIAGPLISWDVYASSSYAIPANQTKFSITLPTDLGSKCATAGDCVIQWFWDAKSIDQTYESCVDFTVGGSGSGSETSPSSAAASAPAATSAAEAEATSSAPVEAAPTSPTTSAAAIPTVSGKACTRLTGAAASSAAAALSASATPAPVVSKTKTKSACTKKTRTAAASASPIAVSAADAVTTAAPTSPTSVAAAPSSSKKACTRLSSRPSGAAVTASPASPTTSAEAEVTPAPSATTAVAESQVSDVLSAIPALTTAIPSEILTSVIPTAVPTSAATGVPVPSTPLPEGTTLKDLLEWVSWVLKTFFSHKGKHSRDMSA